MGAVGMRSGPTDGRRAGHVVGDQDDAREIKDIQDLCEGPVKHVESER